MVETINNKAPKKSLVERLRKQLEKKKQNKIKSWAINWLYHMFSKGKVVKAEKNQKREGLKTLLLNEAIILECKGPREPSKIP